jgi:hypothetical protein
VLSSIKEDAVFGFKVISFGAQYVNITCNIDPIFVLRKISFGKRFSMHTIFSQKTEGVSLRGQRKAARAKHGSDGRRAAQGLQVLRVMVSPGCFQWSSILEIFHTCKHIGEKDLKRNISCYFLCCHGFQYFLLSR